MRAFIAIALLCCALVAQAEAGKLQLSAEARRGLLDDAIKAAADKVVDWLRSTVQSSISTLRTTVENDVAAARSLAEKGVTATKDSVLGSCKNLVDVGAGAVTTFNGKVSGMKDALKNEVAQIENGVNLVKNLLVQFGEALAAFFTPAFDLSGKFQNCSMPKVLTETNQFFQSYLGVQPINHGIWCRFLAIVAKLKLDVAFQKMFDTQRSLFKSTSFLEVDSETGEAAMVSDEVLGASTDWNVVNVVYEVFDGAVDMVSLVLSALDAGPVERAAADAASGGAADAEVAQIVVSVIGIIFKLTSAGLRAAATAKGCAA